METLKDTSKSSPLSSPRIPFPTRLSTTSLPSSPLATYVSSNTAEKSIGEGKEESGKVGSKSKLGKFANSPFFTPSPGYARRGSKSSIGTKGGLDETTMGKHFALSLPLDTFRKLIRAFVGILRDSSWSDWRRIQSLPFFHHS